MNKSIEHRIPYWTSEFAFVCGIDPKPEHEAMVKMALYTMMYEIADYFRAGEFREEILEQFGEK